MEAKQRVLALMPDMSGWTVYPDGVATGAHPPWIVVQFDEIDRGLSEAVRATGCLWRLTIRVVGETPDGVNVACARLHDRLDGRMPDRMGALIPYSDSSVYASELTNPSTSTAYVMRVLTWRVGQ
ncbi:hypothetical protein [Bifidobacterium tissieri]|nr:hypothetical protein [Bifidobacterium tissieri]